MSYTPEYFWKNFRLGTELQISGSFIYNALYFFDQIEHFGNEYEIFEFLYNTSVGLERLEKIAVVLLEHNTVETQKDFEASLKTHNHLKLFEKIRKRKTVQLDKVHNKFISLLSDFYTSMRYDRFSIESVYEPNKDAARFIDFIQKELDIEVKTGMFLPTLNDTKIKNFIGGVVGKITLLLYRIIHDESSNQRMFTYEIPYGSKSYKIFMCEEFTFHKENLFKKEIIVRLLNHEDDDAFVDFVKEIEPLPLENGDNQTYVKYLIHPHKNIGMLEELTCLHEENLDKERMEIVELIGEDGVQFGTEDIENYE